MKNLEIIRILNNIADILELQGVEFKPQAYRHAARGVEALTEDIKEVYEKGQLKEIPGVGESIAEKITEIIETGKLKYYEQLKKEIKINLEELRQIPTLGPKKIKALYQKLRIKNVAELEEALRQQKVRQLEGFGEETEKNLLRGIELFKTKPQRFLYYHALPIVEEIKKYFSKFPFVEKIEIAGSFKRGKETVGDLDFLVVSKQPEKVMKLFAALPEVKEILAQGTTRSSLRFNNGLQIDLRVIAEKEWGSALLYFIGNKEHNIELRKLALSQGYTLNEYGLFKMKKMKKIKNMKQMKKEEKEWSAGRSEEEIYKKLGLQYIPPELRENNEEIKLAREKKIPVLIEVKDIQGLFHNHTKWSDGAESLLTMAQKAQEMKFKFLSFNDHFGYMGITNPLTERRLIGYLKEIEQVRKKVPSLRIFSGIEIDILKDGTLPLTKNKLKELDVVIASVHLATQMSEAEMTKRVCSALENYPINILGHPTDIRLNLREPLKINLEKVFSRAKERSIFLEINSSPDRLDLNGINIKSAIEQGCSLAISTDAHDLSHMENYPLGVMMARRGWAEKRNILNCWSLSKIEKALKK